MGIDTVLGVAGSILAPFAELLSNKTILGIIGLLYVLVQFENWLNRKAALGKYKQELLLKKDKADLEREIMKGDWKDDIDFDKIARHFSNKVNAGGDPTDQLLGFLDEASKDFDWRDWK